MGAMTGVIGVMGAVQVPPHALTPCNLCRGHLAVRISLRLRTFPTGMQDEHKGLAVFTSGFWQLCVQCVSKGSSSGKKQGGLPGWGDASWACTVACRVTGKSWVARKSLRNVDSRERRAICLGVYSLAPTQRSFREEGRRSELALTRPRGGVSFSTEAVSDEGLSLSFAPVIPLHSAARGEGCQSQQVLGSCHRPLPAAPGSVPSSLWS